MGKVVFTYQVTVDNVVKADNRGDKMKPNDLHAHTATASSQLQQ